MADVTTPIISLTDPDVGVEDIVTDWGDKLNANFDAIDALWTSTSPATQIFGSGSAGSSLYVARADHVHPMSATHNDDYTITGAGKGLVVKTPDGTHTYRIAISNDGEVTTELVS